MTVTGEQIKQLIPSLPQERPMIIADVINLVLPKYGLLTPEVLPDFLAQVVHESGGFNSKAENLNYKAARLCAVWPSRFPTIADAEPFANNPVALANKVYNGRMGNVVGSNDGYDFRGAGFIQLTGREIAEQYGAYVGNVDTADLMERVRTEDYWAMDSAAWVFAINKKLIPLAMQNDIVTITKRINGGTLGLDDRKAIFEKAKSIFS